MFHAFNAQKDAILSVQNLCSTLSRRWAFDIINNWHKFVCKDRMIMLFLISRSVSRGWRMLVTWHVCQSYLIWFCFPTHADDWINMRIETSAPLSAASGCCYIRHTTPMFFHECYAAEEVACVARSCLVNSNSAVHVDGTIIRYKCLRNDKIRAWLKPKRRHGIHLYLDHSLIFWLQ